MKRTGQSAGCTVFCLVLMVAQVAGANAYVINFDTVMTHVWASSWWSMIMAAKVLPTDFSLAPATCDINGGLNSSVTPIILYPNGILESDEFALLSAILANASWDRTSTGGASHTMIHNAWNQNLNQARHDMGGGLIPKGPEKLLGPSAMFLDMDYLFTAYVTLGDTDSVAFPLLIMDLAVNNSTFSSLINDPNLHVPVLSNYALMYPYLGWCGDADGDGYSNLSEYIYYYHPSGPVGRAAYLNAAMNPAIHPPSGGGDLICDGNGGLFGEYFNEMTLSNMVLTRVDPTIKFNWGSGSPDPAVNVDHFSIRWTGWVLPEYAETYTFYTASDDGIRLWVNGQLVVDSWIDQGGNEHSGVMAAPFVARQQYPIKIEYYENGGGTKAELWWASPSQTKRVIYDMYLIPGTGEGDIAADWRYNPATQHYYRMSAPGLTWTQAQAEAIQWDGYLTSINNADENAWVRTTYTMFGTLLIGINDEAVEGTYVWANSADNPVSYTNWAQNEPNNSGGVEDYGQMNDSGAWNDIGPTWTGRGIIERNTAPVNYSGPFPASQSIQIGHNASFHVQVRYTTGNVTYQWRHNNVDIPGKTSSVCTISVTQNEDRGTYTCYLTDQKPSSSLTFPANLTVLPANAMPVVCLVGLVLLSMACMAIGAYALRKKRRPAT